MSKLRLSVSNVNRGKRMKGEILDVLGLYCSVRLASNGSKLTRLPYVGDKPLVGDNVYINYSTGDPIVEPIKELTSGILSAARVAATEIAVTTTANAVAQEPPPDEPSSYHNDQPGLQGGKEATTEDVAEMFHLTEDDIDMLNHIYIPFKNQTGATINTMRLVMLAGVLGESSIVKAQLAITDGSYSPKFLLGVVVSDVLDGEDGIALVSGNLRYQDTTGTEFGEVWSEEDLIYNDPANNGMLTNVEPSAPNLNIPFAVVKSVHDTNGSMLVRVSFGYKLGELHDVNGTPPTHGTALVWNAVSEYWDPAKVMSEWYTEAAYLTNEFVSYEGIMYVSLSDANTGNQPDISSSDWQSRAYVNGLIDGLSVERQELAVVVEGTSVYLDIQAIDGGDIDYWIGGTKYTLNCTTGDGVGGKSRIELDQGTAIQPRTNLVYVAYSEHLSKLVLNKTSTSTQPTESYAPVAIATIQDYASVTTNDYLMLQRTTEAIEHNGKGALSWEREKIRALGAQYWSGIDQSLDITTNVGSEDNINFQVTSGQVFQLHRQQLDNASVLSDGIMVANASGDGVLTNFENLVDLNGIHEIADGTALNDGDSINVIVWGSANYGGGNKLFFNLPTGKYTVDADSVNDADKTAVTVIPQQFKTTGYLIAKLVLKYNSANNGTWTNLLTKTVATWHTGLRTWSTTNYPSNYPNYEDLYLTSTNAFA